MKKLLISVAVLGSLVAAYLYAYPIYNFRYRLAVEVEVDGALRSGASVISVRWITWPPFIPLDVDRPFHTTIHGEAVFVDLGSSRRPLVLTLSPNAAPSGCRTCADSEYLPLLSYGMTRDRKGLSALEKIKSKVDAPREYMPGFVTFEDIANPASVRFVDPRRIEDVLGHGVRMRAVTVEATDAPVTQQLEEKLPWVRKPLKGGLVGRLEGARISTVFVCDLIAPDPP